MFEELKEESVKALESSKTLKKIHENIEY